MSAMRRFHTLVIHHSAGPRTQTVASVRRDHIENRDFDDIGYHWIIDGQARLHVGRQIPTQGAHAPPNHGRLGLLILGNNIVARSAWTWDQIEKGREVVRAALLLMPWLDVKGHMQVMRPGYTECPGVDVRELFLCDRPRVFAAHT